MHISTKCVLASMDASALNSQLRPGLRRLTREPFVAHVVPSAHFIVAYANFQKSSYWQGGLKADSTYTCVRGLCGPPTRDAYVMCGPGSCPLRQNVQ